ncbi:MAG: MBOAT family protein, partial [Pirellulales bacterium]
MTIWTLSAWFWPPWAVMWALAAGIYVVCKIVTWLNSRVAAAPWKQAVYLLAWPGMDAEAFLGARVVAAVSAAEWVFAGLKFALGVTLMWLVVPRLATVGICDYAVGWVGMIAIVIMLHFGLFHVLSCLWRTLGMQAEPIMHWPVASKSLAEFWGRRWNRAFRDLTHRFLFRPLAYRVGPAKALLLGFFVSGVLHDAVISVPAGGGYGLPTCFFMVQGLGMLVERSSMGKRIGLGRGVIGWGFCAVIVVLPSVLLFHRPFVEVVVIPFLRAIR